MNAWSSASTSLHLFCFLLLCGGDMMGSTCLILLAQPHMRFSSFSSTRLTGYASQSHNYRFKGTGLGRPTQAVRSRPWVPVQPTRKNLAFVGAGHLASDDTAGTSFSYSTPILVYTAFLEGNPRK